MEIQVNGNKLLLERVLFLPNMLDSLIISTGKLRDNDWNIIETKNKAEIWKEGRQRIVLERSTSGLFVGKFTVKTAETVLQATTDPMVWHRRMGHCSMEVLNEMIRNKTITGVPKLKSKDIGFCTACAEAKQARKAIKSATSYPQGEVHDVLQKVHMDTFEKRERGAFGFKYGVVIIDDWSKYMWVFCAKTKDEIKHKVVSWCSRTENVLNKKIKILRTDNGTEYINEVVYGHSTMHFKHQKSPAGLPQLNGAAERSIRTVKETIETLLIDGQLSQWYWPYAAKYAVYVWNRILRKQEKSRKTPFELVWQRKPDIRHLYTFGAQGFAIPGISRTGVGRTRKATFLGINEESRTYFVRWDDNGSFGQTRDARFDDYSKFHVHSKNVEPSPTHLDSLYTIHTFESPKTTEILPTTQNNTEHQSDDELSEDTPINDNATQPEQETSKNFCDIDTDNIVTYKRVPKPFTTDRILKVSTEKNSNNDPRTFYDIENHPEKKAWMDSYFKELNNFEKIADCSIIDLSQVPEGKRVLPLKEILLTKRDGTKKTRFCLRGDLVPNKDRFEVFSQTTSQSAVRMFFVVSLSKRYTIRRGDIKNAFLNGRTGYITYIWIPKGHPIRYDKHGNLNRSNKFVWRTPAAVYGDPIAPRVWTEAFGRTIISFGLKQSPHEPTVYLNDKMIVVVFVDDLIYAGNIEEMDKFEKFILEKYEGKFNLPLSDFLGFELTKHNNTLYLSQQKYITKAITEFKVPQRKRLTPLPDKLCIKDLGQDKPLEDKTRYQALIGTLSFIALGSRPDITYATNLLARFQQNPTSHTLQLAEQVKTVPCKYTYSENTTETEIL